MEKKPRGAGRVFSLPFAYYVTVHTYYNNNRCIVHSSTACVPISTKVRGRTVPHRAPTTIIWCNRCKWPIAQVVTGRIHVRCRQDALRGRCWAYFCRRLPEVYIMHIAFAPADLSKSYTSIESGKYYNEIIYTVLIYLEYLDMILSELSTRKNVIKLK